MTLALNSLIKINGTEITEHNRKYTLALEPVNEDKILLAGQKRRFIKPIKKAFDFQWSFLPDKANKSVDGKAARDFIYNLVFTNSNVTLSIQEERKDSWVDYVCNIASYDESLIKTDISNQTRYYDISLRLIEV